MSAQIVGQSGGVPQLRRLFSWRRAPARMDSDSDIEIVERVNKKGTPPRLRSLFPTAVLDRNSRSTSAQVFRDMIGLGGIYSLHMRTMRCPVDTPIRKR